MTQKLPFKEPGRAHKRRNNTGRLTFHFVLFALLGVMLLSLGAYGRVKLHGIYDQQLLSRRSDSLITDSTNLVKTTAEALAGTNNSLRTKISSGLSSKSRSVKNTAAQMLTTGSSDQETLAFIVDTLSQAAVSKLKDDDEAQSALKIAVAEKLSAERDNIIATVLADTNAQIQAMSIEDVRRSLTMQTPGYTMMFYSILMLWVGGVLCGSALAVASNLQQFGISFTTVGKAGFLTALYIVIVPILGLFLKKRVPATVWVSVVIAAAGTYLLSVQEGFTIAPGDLLVILCALGFSVHILIIDHFSPMVNGVALSCVQFLVCGILCTAAALFTETFTLADILKSAGPLLFTGLMSSGVGYTLQILGQKDTPPAVASLIMSLESVFAALSGWLVLGQSMNGRELLGCVLVFAAVILAQIPLEALKKKKAVKKTA